MLEGFYPKGWDMQKIDACCDHAPEEITERQDFWNKDFTPISCKNVAEFDVKMGHEIANEIRKANAEGRKIVFILPVGPMGMYKWAVYFLREWNVSCENVYCFNMDEWADGEGNTITGDAAFLKAGGTLEDSSVNALCHGIAFVFYAVHSQLVVVVDSVGGDILDLVNALFLNLVRCE
jgi:hypothetical protein